MEITMTQHNQTQGERDGSPGHTGRQDPQIGQQEQARQHYRKQKERVPTDQGEEAEKRNLLHNPLETNDEDSELDNGTTENHVGREDIAEQENEDLEIDEDLSRSTDHSKNK
jgi:hypothetical protein